MTPVVSVRYGSLSTARVVVPVGRELGVEDESVDVYVATNTPLKY